MTPPAPDPAPAPPGSPRPPLLPVREFPDRGSLWLFEDPQHLRGLLQLLDPGLAEQLDFDHARRENRSFIPADLQKQESDLIFLVPFRGGRGSEVWVYLLLEHQSEPDPEMGLRLYLYMGEIWGLQRREWKDHRTPSAQRRLRPVIPLVYYTGEKRWSAPLGLISLMDLPAELERFVPQWETLFMNLRQTPPELLTRFATAVGWALRVWQADKAPLGELERVLTEAMAGLEGLPPEQAGQWLRVAWFFMLLVIHRREELELPEFILDQARQSKFGEREVVMTMGQSILEQLEARGEARATRAALETVLQARFGPLPEPILLALTEANVDTMKAWLVQATNAPTLAAVGIIPQEPTS